MVRRIPSRQRNAPIARERDQGVLFRFSLLLLCGLILAGGFVYAGVQHFASLRLGYQTEAMRKVRSELAEEQRRFLLEREAAASPARLERAARQLGMQSMQAAQIDPLKRAARVAPEQSSPAVNSTGASPAGNAQPKLIKAPTSERSGPVAGQSVPARTR
jgi:cell division protein FtsL